MLRAVEGRPACRHLPDPRRGHVHARPPCAPCMLTVSGSEMYNTCLRLSSLFMLSMNVCSSNSPSLSAQNVRSVHITAYVTAVRGRVQG